jgi:C-terminal processing protease CtpA/Prc
VSTAEEFVVSLVDSGRAQTVGRQSGGSTGNPLVFQLPGDGSARFSTGDLRRIDGAAIEGVGIQPDLPVAWTLADVRQGRDPDLAAAVRLLLPSRSSQVENPFACRDAGRAGRRRHTDLDRILVHLTIQSFRDCYQGDYWRTRR